VAVFPSVLLWSSSLRADVIVAEDSQASRCFTISRSLDSMHQSKLPLHPHHSTRRPRQQASGVDGEAEYKVPYSSRIGMGSEQDPGEHRRSYRPESLRVLYQSQMAGSRGHPDPAAHTSPRPAEAGSQSDHSAEADILPGSLHYPGPLASSRA
jgi:hypothetical protein